MAAGDVAGSPGSVAGGRRSRAAPRRIFIGLTDVAGYFGCLTEGFISAGIPVMFVDESPDPFRYRSPSLSVRIARALVVASSRAKQGRARVVWAAVSAALRGLRLATRMLAFGVAVARCDTFILTAGAGFFGGRELPLLRRLGKTIVWVFTGSDHRPPYLNGRMVRAAGTTGWDGLAATTRRVSAVVRRVERYADVIVAHTASAQLHSRPFVRFLSIGIPTRPAPRTADAVASSTRRGERVRIVHSPSDPESKGTPAIRAIIDRLATGGRPIAYTEVVGASHAEVLAQLAGADLLLNEFWGDTPMGVLAAEAAALGVPTATGSYYAHDVVADTAPEAIPPSAFVAPEALESAVAELITDDDRRLALGAAAAEFVATRWTPRAVAERYLRLIRGEVPAAWLVDPSTIAYVGGWGMPADDRTAALRAYVAARGADALCLPPRSRIRERIELEVAEP